MAFNYLLGNEGMVFTNYPSDPGGPTKYGVTLRAYQNYLNPEATAIDIQNLNPDQAKEVYQLGFWTPMGCEALEDVSTPTCIFDTGVLFGPGISAGIAQRSLNNLGASLTIDNILGPESISQLNSTVSDEFIDQFHGQVLFRIDKVILDHPNLENNRQGWVNRANRLLNLKDPNFLINLVMPT